MYVNTAPATHHLGITHVCGPLPLPEKSAPQHPASIHTTLRGQPPPHRPSKQPSHSTQPQYTALSQHTVSVHTFSQHTGPTDRFLPVHNPNTQPSPSTQPQQTSLYQHTTPTDSLLPAHSPNRHPCPSTQPQQTALSQHLTFNTAVSKHTALSQHTTPADSLSHHSPGMEITPKIQPH